MRSSSTPGGACTTPASWGGEVLYVISGRGRQTVGEDPEPFGIAEGDAVYILRDTLHSTYNTTWSPLRPIVVFTPGGAKTVIDERPDACILDTGVAPTGSQFRWSPE